MKEHPVIFWGYISFVVIMLIKNIIEYKRVRPSKAEYLEVLSCTEWKSGWSIRNELGRRHGGWVNICEFYITMQELESENLIEVTTIPEEASYDYVKTVVDRVEYRRIPRW